MLRLKRTGEANSYYPCTGIISIQDRKSGDLRLLLLSSRASLRLKRTGSDGKVVRFKGSGTKFVANSAEDLRAYADEIARSVLNGRSYNRIRVGTNKKIVIIGRGMEYVTGVADRLNVELLEVLDDDYLTHYYQSGGTFDANGRSWTVSEAWDNLVRSTEWDNYRAAGAGTEVKAEYAHLTPMYKINKQWIDKIVAEGATIIDIGNPGNNTKSSVFYDMEIGSVIWD